VRNARAFGLTVVLALAACPKVDPSQGLQTTPAAQLFDYDDFVCEAMPVLVRRCSYLACHGDSSHALRIYAPSKLRLVAPATRKDRDAQLTADEIEANFDSATTLSLGAKPLSPGEPVQLQDEPILQKPLAARFGGAEHHGIAIFPVFPQQTLETDPEWLALASWVAGKKQSPPDAKCASLFSALGVAPR
jgi:hypothetical protein